MPSSRGHLLEVRIQSQAVALVTASYFTLHASQTPCAPGLRWQERAIYWPHSCCVSDTSEQDADGLLHEAIKAASAGRETRVCGLNAGCQNWAELTWLLKKVAEGIQYKTAHPISNKVHYFPSEHTCTLLVKLTPLFGVAARPARPNWSGAERCGAERGPNGAACLAADKARSVTGSGVNVFPLLAAGPHDSQEREAEESQGEPGGPTGGVRAQTG